MIQYSEKTLTNGLNIVVNRDLTTELVTVNLLYNVGSKNENENHTGFAHLFEHLMFSGSKNYPDFDNLINSIGGESNAFTNCDITNFYCTVPGLYLETILRIEADRMCNLIIDESHLTVQKKVVTEEFKQRYLNQPYGDLYKLIRELSYTTHPYKWQTIGKDISHIESADLDIVRNFYQEFYNPSNAVLAVSGNIKDTEEVFALAENIFNFENRGQKTVNYKSEPLQTENRFSEVYRDVPANVIAITFPMCKRADSDFYVFDLLSDILSNGKSSRLYDALVRNKRIFTGIDAVVSGDDDNGLFMITGKCSDGIDIKTAEDSIWEELHGLIDNPPSEQEFQKVKNKNRATATFNNIKIADKAFNLAYYKHLNILDRINSEYNYYNNVSVAGLQSLADKIFFNDKHNTLYYRTK